MIKAFLSRMFLFLKLFLLWLFFFSLARLCFLVYQHELTNVLPVSDWALALWHGLRHDLSISSYLMLFPLFLAAIGFFLPQRIYAYVLHGYTLILLVVICLVIVTDMELYTHWGFRLDATPFLFIDHPKEMLASVSLWVVIRQLIIGLVLAICFYIPYRLLIYRKLLTAGKQGWISLPALLIVMAFLIIPIRGGLSVAPMNIGAVYFSNKPIANHAAVNVIFNLGYSLTHLNADKNPYIFVENEHAQRAVDSLSSQRLQYSPILLNTPKPNILIVLLESFTAKAIASFGGLDSITPNFNEAARTGVKFANLYASGSRSDRGIVAVLSGYPALPTQGIMLYPSKSESLPFLSRKLNEFGYHSSFYYGGDIDFGGMRSFLTMGGFSKIVSLSDFSSSAYKTKWGVFDHVVFDTLARQIRSTAQPFFTVFFTLSSHEPFIIPGKPIRAGEDVDSKFLSAINYTDSCLGDFLEKAHAASWWKNTLVILVADHGSRYPGIDGPGNYKRYHIPMLWTGGAIRKDTTISVFCSQADLPVTLLSQLKLDYSDFKYSRNILTLEDAPSMFFFNDGFGYVSKGLKYAWDNKLMKLIETDTVVPESALFLGRAYQQVLVNDFVSR
jgi:phosphoglycerol transferase MdoB-like AlkP superfamily enzyme